MAFRKLSKTINNKRIKGIIFGDCGVLLDGGLKVPINSVINVFNKEMINVTRDDVLNGDGPWDTDVVKLLQNNEISNMWKDKKGRVPVLTDCMRLISNIPEEHMELLDVFGKTIPGAESKCRELYNRDIEIGVVSGFNSHVLNHAFGGIPEIKQYIHTEDMVGIWNHVTPSAELMTRWEIPPDQILRVDSTRSGIQEGKSSGCWTAGIASYGQIMGCDETQLGEFKSELPEIYEVFMLRARRSLRESGANYVMDDISDLFNIIDHIEDNYLIND